MGWTSRYCQIINRTQSRFECKGQRRKILKFFLVSLLKGNTPLHEASGDGHKEVVQILIEHGADPGLKNRLVSYFT